MISTFSKSMIVCVALSTVCFASTAHAGNAFNKFPTQPAASKTQGLQVSTYVVTSNSNVDVVTTKRRIKRRVEPVPTIVSPSVTYASDHGTTNMKRGFNKMVTQANRSESTMPVLVDNRAFTAR